MKLSQTPALDFDLGCTLDSGQVFHWERCDNGYVGTIDQEAVYVEQRGPRLYFTGTRAVKIRNYFALDHPLREICNSFPKDPAMQAARDFSPGLRIIRQPLWECLATFITSSMKQMAHIRQISHILRKRYGLAQKIFGLEAYSFPSSERLANLTENDLRKCALGYRAGNLLTTAQLVTNGNADLDRWRELADDSLRASLCELPGVGAKVAHCVMLFAYERLGAFPIDVWIERVLRQEYFPRKRKMTPRRLRLFCEAYFGPYGGYAQQYLFHHARKAKSRSKSMKKPGRTASC